MLRIGELGRRRDSLVLCASNFDIRALWVHRNRWQLVIEIPREYAMPELGGNRRSPGDSELLRAEELGGGRLHVDGLRIGHSTAIESM